MQSYMHILDSHSGLLHLQLSQRYTIRWAMRGCVLSEGCRKKVSGGPEGFVAVATTFLRAWFIYHQLLLTTECKQGKGGKSHLVICHIHHVWQPVASKVTLVTSVPFGALLSMKCLEFLTPLLYRKYKPKMKDFNGWN